MSIRFERSAGVLMPIFSLPSKYGIGSFSKEAYEFVDRLHMSKQHYWQILPINPVGPGNSPYQSCSTFAGNPLFIDIDSVIEDGMLEKSDIAGIDFDKDTTKVDYKKTIFAKEKVLRICFEKSFDKRNKQYQIFLKKNDFWIEDYAMYMALSEHFGNTNWNEWEDGVRRRIKSTLDDYKNKLESEIDYHKFVQFLFFKQWTKLKKYANSKKVKIIGDIPIYVGYESCDVWQNPDLFMLDKNMMPSLLAGCPPDEFSKKGQLWGNPVYNWKRHKKTEYLWWIKRIEFAFKMCDVLRIDHFRGFESFYAVKAGSKDATEGKWYKGPGYTFFSHLKANLGLLSIIAEDLGFTTIGVEKLLQKTGFYGMKIFQFGFEKGKITEHIPYMYPNTSVAYTGTHDNDTIIGWYNNLKEKDKKNVNEFIGKGELNIELIKNVLFSASDIAIIPMADYLSLGSVGRINTPSTIGENWQWRMTNTDFSIELAKKIAHLTKLSLRA